LKKLLTASGGFAILGAHTVTTIEITTKMRTKTLVLVAALAAAGLATSMAQNVYSLNVVGYVNVNLPPVTTAGGFAILCNPLSNGSNTLAEILPTAPLNTAVYVFNGVSYAPSPYYFAEDDDGNTNWGAGASVVLAPGQGFWVKNPAAVTNKLTFVGEVLQGAITNPVPAGFALRGSPVPQSLILKDPAGSFGTNDLAYPATLNQTVIYRFKALGGYDICVYGPDDDGNPSWSSAPIPQVGEGFWTLETSAKPWVRNFTVQ
jgi:hypothetical protein